MTTFSINTGQVTESTSYPLTGDLSDSNFVSILERLEDNLSGQINPVDIRDSILSLWSNTTFKITSITQSNIRYIGFDTINPLNNDIKDRKILIGKRSNSFGDTLNDGILQSDSDIIMYNTKLENTQQIRTKINILASQNFDNSTFIQSQVLFGTSSISFDFINNSGNINTEGLTIINDLIVPPGVSASSGKVIIKNQNSANWGNIAIQTPSDIGVTFSELNIYGDPIKVNGYDINFTDSRKSPIEIGDIRLGETFDNINFNDMLRRIIYSYLSVTTDIRIIEPFSSGVVELGTRPNVILEYTINKKTNITGIIQLVNMIPSSAPAILSNNYQSVTATASGLIINPLTSSGVTFSVVVSDGIQQSQSSTNIRGVVPYFWGLLNTGLNNLSLQSLNKLIEDKSDKSINISGSGNLFFLYDSSYGPLLNIFENGVIDNSFSSNTITLSSNSWTNRQFIVYIKNGFSSQFPVSYKFEY